MYSNILNIEKRKYEYELWAEYESDLILIWDGFLIFSDSQTTVSLLSATVTCQWCQCQCTFSQTVKHSWFWILDQLLQIAVQVQVVSNCKLHILTQPAPSWRYEIQWWSEWSCIAESWANAWPSCRSSHLLEAIQGGMQGRPGSYFDFVFRPSVQPRESHGRQQIFAFAASGRFTVSVTTCDLLTHWHHSLTWTLIGSTLRDGDNKVTKSAKAWLPKFSRSGSKKGWRPGIVTGIGIDNNINISQ